MHAKAFPDQTLDAVAVDSAPRAPLGDCQTQTRLPLIIGRGNDYKTAIHMARAILEDVAERPGVS